MVIESNIPKSAKNAPASITIEENTRPEAIRYPIVNCVFFIMLQYSLVYTLVRQKYILSFANNHFISEAVIPQEGPPESY